MPDEVKSVASDATPTETKVVETTTTETVTAAPVDAAPVETVVKQQQENVGAIPVPTERDKTYTIEDINSIKAMLDSNKQSVPVAQDTRKEQIDRNAVQRIVDETITNRAVEPAHATNADKLMDLVKDQPDVADKILGILSKDAIAKGSNEPKAEEVVLKPDATLKDIAENHKLSEHEVNTLSYLKMDNDTKNKALESKDVVDALLYRASSIVGKPQSSSLGKKNDARLTPGQEYAMEEHFSDIMREAEDRFSDINNVTRQEMEKRDERGTSYGERVVAAVKKHHQSRLLDEEGNVTPYAKKANLVKDILSSTYLIKTDSDPITAMVLPNNTVVPLNSSPVSNNIKNILSKDHKGEDIRTGDVIPFRSIFKDSGLHKQDKSALDEYCISFADNVKTLLQSQGLQT